MDRTFVTNSHNVNKLKSLALIMVSNEDHPHYYQSEFDW